MKIFRKILCGLLALAVVLGCAAAANPQAVRAEGEETFFINPSQGGISTFSLDNSSNLNVNNERYDKFCWDKTNPGDSSCPQLGTGLKYIVGDDLNPDGRGNWRGGHTLHTSENLKFRDSPDTFLRICSYHCSEQKADGL